MRRAGAGPRLPARTCSPPHEREAGARISNELDHFETARDVKCPTVKRQIIVIGNDILDIRRISVERARMHNVLRIDIEGNQVPRVLSQVTVNVAFAATDIDQTLYLGCALDAVQCLQDPALPAAVSRQKELVIHTRSPYPSSRHAANSVKG